MAKRQTFDHQRLKNLLEVLIQRRIVYNQKDFAEIAGIGATQMTMLLNGTRPFSELYINKICKAFPAVSKDWLLTGNGDVILEKKEKPADPTMELILSQQRTIENLSNAIRSQQDLISRLVKPDISQ